METVPRENLAGPDRTPSAEESARDAAEARRDRAAARRAERHDRVIGRCLIRRVRHLRRPARHEVRIAEVLGRVPRNAVDADDVVDEVLARAWSDFDFRPRGLTLDMWLNGIYTEVVGDLLDAKPEQVPFADELDPRQLKDEIGDPLASHHEPFWPYADSDMLGEVVPDPAASAESTAAIDIEEEST